MNAVKLLINLFRFNRTNWKAVSLCFLAAAVFWLFNAFNKNYATEIRFPLHIEYNQSRFVPIATLPTELKLNVSGNGWDLFRKSLGLRLPELTINLERPLEVKRIAGTALPPLLAAQLNGLTINHVVTDTLRLLFDEQDVHTFGLKADLSEVWFRDGFGITSPVTFTPDSVKIEGARSVLHRMPEKILIKLPRLMLDESYNHSVEIVVDDAVTTRIDPPRVQVQFEVGLLETVGLRLPIEILNKPERVKSLKADSATVWVRLPAAQQARLQQQLRQLRVQVDLKAKPAGAHRLLPKISPLPSGVELIRIDSVEVKF
ncbi:MAG: hypothetical protein J0L66_06300 [Cytophagales bacterium]|nr:hypothetical protein [Cytophagales bacterium]